MLVGEVVVGAVLVVGEVVGEFVGEVVGAVLVGAVLVGAVLVGTVLVGAVPVGAVVVGVNFHSFQQANNIQVLAFQVTYLLTQFFKLTVVNKLFNGQIGSAFYLLCPSL